jgi:hypothetical protein
VLRIVLKVLALGMGLGFLGAVMAVAGGAGCAEASPRSPSYLSATKAGRLPDAPPSYFAATKSGPVPAEAPVAAETPKRPSYFYATKSGHIPTTVHADPPPQAQQAR